MPTKQWLQDNPKAIAYLPKAVHKRLQEFSTEHQLSVSHAIIMILEDYFKLQPQQVPSPSNAHHDAELNELKQELESLRAIVTELQKQRDPATGVASATDAKASEQTSTPRARGKSSKAKATPTSSPKADSPGKASKTRFALSGHTTNTENSEDREEASPVLKTTRLPRSSRPKEAEEQEPISDKQEQSPNEEKRSPAWSNPNHPLHGFLSKFNPQLKGRQSNKALDGSSADGRPALPPSSS